MIPARGGSKRIKRKNLKEFCGKPIIAYSIENALKSGIFSKIIVSSDDAEILEFAKNSGVFALKRPAELSDDYCGTRDVIIHAISALGLCDSTLQNSEDGGQKSLCHCEAFAKSRSNPHYNKQTTESTSSLREFSLEFSWQSTLQNSGSGGRRAKSSQNPIVCCLYATAPLLDSSYLQEAFKITKQKATNCYCFSACEFSYSPFRAFCIENGKNKMLFKEHFAKRSQDLEKVYHDAGAFYFATADTWQNRENIFENSISFLLPQERVQDIDTLEDWNLAELKFRALNLG